jgi:hypothetical protein
MELCDSSVLENFMTRLPRPRMHRMSPVDGPPQGKRRLASRCSCRQCPTCVDSARWERIFQEKFADPHYYEPRLVRHTSSLDSIV